MKSADVIEKNVKKIREAFPGCVTEITENGKVKLAVDFDALKEELTGSIITDKQERYLFTWPDKAKAKQKAVARISATLRPCREESVSFDTTENVYIEGNNSEVLKLLQEPYLGKIKMVYIDPPYNTGNNIIYKNDFSQNAEEYIQTSGQLDVDGNRLTLNTESNGRFHTDWLNIMYPVLRLAKDLIREDGYIAVAIDDNELYNLKKLADEIFGESNYVGTIVTKCNPQGRNKNNIDPVHEYHLIYARSILKMPLLRIGKDGQSDGYGYLMRSGTNSRKNERPYRFYPMLYKDGKVSVIERDEYGKIYNPQTGFDEEYIAALKAKYESLGYAYILPISHDGEYKVWQRVYDRVKDECGAYIYEKGQIKVPAENDRTPVSLWSEEKYSNVAYGTNNLKALFGNNTIPFDFSKSIYTVKDLISLNTGDGDIILDFFSGSATTAHAVMQLNAEDGGNRKFIMVQLPEPCGEKSEAYKAGYKNICEIGKERIRRAGKKITEEFENSKRTGAAGARCPDVGFRDFKLDSSNMQPVFYNPRETKQSLLDTAVDNIKPDRTPLDLLFQVMLDLGVLLSAGIEEKQIAGKKYYAVNGNCLIACFDDDIDNSVITEIAKKKPLYAVFKDKSFASDSVGINNEQLFKTYSPSTVVKVI